MRIYYSLKFDGEKRTSEELLVKALRLEGIMAKYEDIYRKESGKPYLKDSDVQFSISHSSNVWICVFSDCRVGIDFQFFKELEFNKVAKRFFSIEENAFLLSKGKDEQSVLFFEIWARKEAAAKLFETGIFKNGVKNIHTVKKKGDDYQFADIAMIQKGETFLDTCQGIWAETKETEKVKNAIFVGNENIKFSFSICAEKLQIVEDVIEIG